MNSTVSDLTPSSELALCLQVDLRRTAEGKSKQEILRCLKRFIAREVYRLLQAGPLRPAAMGA